MWDEPEPDRLHNAKKNVKPMKPYPTYILKGALDNYNIIPQPFQKKL